MAAVLGRMASRPPMKGRRAWGMTTDPSLCWKFSKMQTSMRGTAQPVAFSVCANSVPFAWPLGRYRMLSRRAW